MIKVYGFDSPKDLILAWRSSMCSRARARTSRGLSKASSMAKARKNETELPKKEAEDRRDRILKRMLNTPPKPRKGKGGVKRAQRSKEI